MTDIDLQTQWDAFFQSTQDERIALVRRYPQLANLKEKESQKSLLHWAVKDQQKQLVEVLLEVGSVPMEDRAEQSPLVLCANRWEENHPDMHEIIRMLTEHALRQDPHHPHVLRALSLSWSIGWEEMSTILLEHPLDPHHVDPQMKTSLLDEAIYELQSAPLARWAQEGKVSVEEIKGRLDQRGAQVKSLRQKTAHAACCAEVEQATLTLSTPPAGLVKPSLRL